MQASDRSGWAKAMRKPTGTVIPAVKRVKREAQGYGEVIS